MNADSATSFSMFTYKSMVTMKPVNICALWAAVYYTCICNVHAVWVGYSQRRECQKCNVSSHVRIRNDLHFPSLHFCTEAKYTWKGWIRKDREDRDFTYSANRWCEP